MKASELRIGNYATIENGVWPTMKGIPLIVNGTRCYKDNDFPASTGDVNLNEGEYNQFDEFIRPVPLTEEWLLKFGFELQLRGTIKDYLKFNSDGVSEMLISSINGTEWTTYGVRYKIQYVHQLQNLYYALTGQELTEGQHEANRTEERAKDTGEL
jgi:hypothetical protein